MLIEVDQCWFDNGAYSVDIEITSLNGGSASHGQDVVLLSDIAA